MGLPFIRRVSLECVGLGFGVFCGGIFKASFFFFLFSHWVSGRVYIFSTDWAAGPLGGIFLSLFLFFFFLDSPFLGPWARLDHSLSNFSVYFLPYSFICTNIFFYA